MAPVSFNSLFESLVTPLLLIWLFHLPLPALKGCSSFTLSSLNNFFHPSQDQNLHKINLSSLSPLPSIPNLGLHCQDHMPEWFAMCPFILWDQAFLSPFPQSLLARLVFSLSFCSLSLFQSPIILAHVILSLSYPTPVQFNLYSFWNLYCSFAFCSHFRFT